MWHHAGQYLCGLLHEASPRATVLVLPYIRWDWLTDREDLIRRWATAASAIPCTEEIAQSVVDTLLQIASEEELLSSIPLNVWSWLTKRPHLPPICVGRNIGTCPHVLKAVRALKDIEVLKSYFLLVWSEWNMPGRRPSHIPDIAPPFQLFASPESTTYSTPIIRSPASSYGLPAPRLPRVRHSMMIRPPSLVPYITDSVPTLPPSPIPYAIDGRPLRYGGPQSPLSTILSIDSGPIHHLSPIFSTNNMPIRPPSPISSIIGSAPIRRLSTGSDSTSSSRSYISRDRTSSLFQFRQSADSFPAPHLRRVPHLPVPPSPPILDSTSISPSPLILDSTSIPPSPPILGSTSIPPSPPALDRTSIPPSPPILGNTSVPPSPPISTSSIHSSTSYYSTSIHPQSARSDSGSIRTPPHLLGSMLSNPIPDSSYLSGGFYDMWISVREDFGGSGMGHHRTELLQRLDHVLERLDRGLEYLKQYNPELDEDYLQRTTYQYQYLRETLLETDIRAISRTSHLTIMPLCMLTPVPDVQNPAQRLCAHFLSHVHSLSCWGRVYMGLPERVPGGTPS
jgi:hypothetical protein